MNFNGIFYGLLILFISFIIAVVIGVMVSLYFIGHSIVDDCETMGMFHHDDTTYICKVKDERE